MRVVTVQFRPEFGKKETNLAKLEEIIDKVSKEISGVDIVAIPKWFSTGFLDNKEDVANWAEPIPGPTTNALGNICRKNEIYMVGGTLVERDGQKLFDTCPFIVRDGKLIGKYRRMHIGAHHAKLGMVNGTPNNYPVFETDKGVIGIYIAHDNMFPEVPRILSLKGAQVLFWVGATDYKRINAYGKLLDAHAFANQVYIVACNQAGRDNIGKYFFFGNSRIINPLGETVASAGTFCTQDYQNRIAYADLNLSMTKEWREKPASLLSQRRPETYSRICS